MIRHVFVEVSIPYVFAQHENAYLFKDYITSLHETVPIVLVKYIRDIHGFSQQCMFERAQFFTIICGHLVQHLRQLSIHDDGVYLQGLLSIGLGMRRVHQFQLFLLHTVDTEMEEKHLDRQKSGNDHDADQPNDLEYMRKLDHRGGDG